MVNDLPLEVVVQGTAKVTILPKMMHSPVPSPAVGQGVFKGSLSVTVMQVLVAVTDVKVVATAT